MAATGVIAMGPVEFTDAGQEFVVPLGMLSFDSAGALVVDWPPYAQHKTALDPWLDYLRSSGLLRPAPQPPPAAAMVIAAAATGSTGNDITITFANVDESAATFDATLTQTDVYAGLTPDTIVDVLGAAAGQGGRPGLVFVSSSGQPKQPADGAVQLTGGPPATAKIPAQGSGDAFTVKARDSDPDAARTAEISASADAASPGTFTLTATWTKTAIGIGVVDLAAGFASEITVAAPPGGQELLPAAGTVSLRGGSDAASPTNASVTVTAQ